MRRPTYALAILTFINLFNYIDRWVVAAVVEPLRKALLLTDTQVGFVLSAFIVVFAITSPVFGRLGDRRARPPLIAIGVAIWSLATGLAGFARGFWSLFFARAAVGVGEAAYGAIAPALLADHFPRERRGRVLAVFFAAVPVGSAAGYVLGGWADKEFGWRAAFWLAGFPGMVLALLVLLVKDAPRGGQDAQAGQAGLPVLHLLRNRAYVLAVLGYAAYTFALGGLASWMPAFLERVRGLPRAESTVAFGAIVLVTGLAGTFLGGFLGDWLLPRTRQAYLWVSGIATLLAAPLTLVGLTSRDKVVFLTAIVIAEVLVFMCTGPINSAILNMVSPLERATAVGLSVLVMQALGNIPAPIAIGAISDASSLAKGVLIVPAAMVIAGMIWSYAAWSGGKTAP